MNPDFRFSLRHAVTAVALAFALAPAAAPAQAPAQQPATPGGDKSMAGARGARDARSQQGLTAEIMYRLLVGDVALQRGDAALAARAYYEAARDTRDPRIARRATEISLAARQRALALDSAKLWAELEPTAERPKQVIAGLQNGSPVTDGRAFGSELQTELERALAEAAAGPAGRLGEAFMQINRLLANEPDKVATFKLVRALAQPYPNVAEAHFAVAFAAYNTGLTDMGTTAIATQEVDRALALKPLWEQGILLKVEILAKNAPDRAADYLVELLKTEPDSKAALSALAQVRIQQKRYAEAADILDKLWEKDKDNHEYQFGMAMLAIQMKDWARAEKLFEELKKVDYGDDGVVEFYLAQIAEETGRYELALERFKEVPDGERGWLAKLRAGLMLGKLGRLNEAREYLAALPAVSIEQQVQVQQTQAQVMRDAGDNATAYAILVAALVKYPDDPDLLYDTAMVAEKLDKLDVVEQKLKRLIELKPSNAHALNALGYTLVDRTNRTAEGLALVERALVLAPDDPFILD
ncbi:MAG TPA: tetratricopeptide repeat protein, partial [Casimicrobiaceae bacterium]|nr:tetratricopeptide repeat protein [Casimicrobiaceae bacterium]